MIHTLGSSEEVVTVVAVGGGLAVAIVSIIASAFRKTAQTRAREESRRELAAYVAEGSMSPDDAAKLMAAGGKSDKPGSCGC